MLGGRICKSVLTRSPRRQILTTVDVQDAVLTLPVFGTLGRKRSEVTDPGQFALDAKLLYWAYSFRGVQAADCHGDAAALYAVICQRGAAATAKIPLCDVRAHEGRRAPARPAQVFAPDTRERHEWLTGCPLAHPAMANARVLRRREQLIAHSPALTAASPLGRVFLDNGHVVFHMFSRPSANDATMEGHRAMSRLSASNSSFPEDRALNA